MDIVGPLPTAQGNFKFAVVVVKYFTKWIEAKPLATITLPTIRNSSGSKSYVDSECPKSSLLTTGSNSTTKISGSIVDQLERSFASRLCTTLSPTAQ
jgi:hypothetical protein